MRGYNKNFILQKTATSSTYTKTGDIVSFTTPNSAGNAQINKNIVHIEPYQNLHGYEYPWPAGGGKNLIDDSIKYQASTSVLDIGTNNTYTIPLKAGTYTLTIQFLNGVHYGAYYREQNASANTTIWTTDAVDTSKTFTISTDGLYRVWVYHANGVDAANIGQVQLEAGSSSTSYAPYSNVCPISGWTGVRVTRAGKNLYSGIIGLDVFVNNQGATHSSDADILTVTCAASVSSGVYASPSSVIRQLFGSLVGTYTYSFDIKANKAGRINAGIANKGGYVFDVGTSWQRIAITSVFNNDGASTGFVVYNSGQTENMVVDVKDFQLELGSSATSYELYQGDIYNITFPAEAGTVYGGTLDVTNGVLTVDRAMVDLGTLSWTKDSNNGYFRATVPDILNPKTYGDRNKGMICSIYAPSQTTSLTTTSPDEKTYLKNASIVYIRDSTYVDANAFKGGMSGVQLVYELATPVTYTLTPQEITLLQGNNTLYADAGSIELEYSNFSSYSPSSTGTLNKVVYLTEPQANTLFESGTITSNGNTVNYSDNDLYLSSQEATPGSVIYGGHDSLYHSSPIGQEGQFLTSHGSNTPNWKNITRPDIKPLVSKTYTNVLATANDQDNGVFFFGTVNITNTSNYYAPWWVHYTMEVTTSEVQTQGYYDVWVSYCGPEIRYCVWNDLYSGSYLPTHHHRTLYPKSGYSNQGAHLGFRLQSARNPTTLARTYKINILEYYGCTVNFKDTLITYSNLYNATYYNSGEFNGTSAGLQESGDADSYAQNIRYGYARITTGNIGIGRYTLFMQAADGTYQSITSTFNNTGTAHVANTTKFHPEQIYYRNSGSDLTANNSSDTANSWMYSQYTDLIDARYSFNCAQTLTGRKPIYLVGTIDDEGLFTLSVTTTNSINYWYTQDLPTTEDGKVYIYLGTVYSQDNSNGANTQYRIILTQDNPIYWYKDGAIRLYNKEALSENALRPVFSETDTYNSSYNRHFFISLTKTTLDTATIHFKVTLLKNTSDKYNIIEGKVSIFSPTTYSYNLTQSVADFNTFYMGNTTGTNQYHLGIGNADHLVTGYNQIKIEVLSCTNCTPAIAYSNLSDSLPRTFSSYLIQLGSNTNNLTVANDLTVNNDLEVTNSLTVKGETIFYNNVFIPPGSLFYSTTVSKTISVSYHAASTGTINFNVPEGYRPLCIRAWTLSGTGSSYTHVYKMSVGDFNEENSTAKITYGLFGHNSTTVSPKLNVSVLCYRYTPAVPVIGESELEED